MAPKDQQLSKAEPQAASTERSKLFSCDKCQTSGFKTIGAKRRYDREIHGYKIYACKYCGFTAKRRYQLTDHQKSDHPEQQDTTASNALEMSSNRSSCDSIDGYSSNDTAAESSGYAQQPLPPFDSNWDSSKVYNASSAGFSQPSYGSSYPTVASPPVTTSYNATSSPSMSSHMQSQTFQSPFSTIGAQIAIPQSTMGSWSAHLDASTYPFSSSTAMSPQSQPNYANPAGGGYPSGYDNGMQYDTSSYSTTSSEQVPPLLTQTARNLHTKEPNQSSDWSKQSFAKPQ